MDYYLLNVVCMMCIVLLMLCWQGLGLIVNILMFVVFEFDLDFLMLVVFWFVFVGYIKFFVNKFVVEGICMNNVFLGFIDSLLEFLECMVCILVGCYVKV